MGGFADDEIPLPSMLFYLFHDAALGDPRGLSDSSVEASLRAAWETTSGGEFGWGGTSVKR